jgi:hypothetical protein
MNKGSIDVKKLFLGYLPVAKTQLENKSLTIDDIFIPPVYFP